MKDLVATSIKYEQGRLWLLDQRQLPQQQCWLACDTVANLVEMIQAAQIQGASLLGVSASLLLAHLANQGADREQLMAAAEQLAQANQTAVAMEHCLRRMLAALETGDRLQLIRTAEQIFAEDVQLCEQLASQGAALLHSGERILTQGHSGSLSCAGMGTALAVVARAQQQGKRPFVWLAESRPLEQGQLSSWELSQLGVEHGLLCDNLAASLMQQGKVDKVLLAVEGISRDGQVISQAGAYALAVLARHHQLPCYVVAPSTSLEHAEAAEPWQPATAPATTQTGTVLRYQPLVDRLPAELISAWIFEHAVYDRQQVQQGCLAQIRDGRVR